MLRIHKNGNDHGRAFVFGRPHKGEMTFVKCAHGGDEADEALFGLGVARNLLHPFNCADDLHGIKFREKD